LSRSLEVRKPNTIQIVPQSSKNNYIDNKITTSYQHIDSARKVSEISKVYTRDKEKDAQTDRKIEYK